VYLVDGTYELFRQHYGMAASGRGGAGAAAEFDGVRGVLESLVALLADGVTHVGVATDHVVESFRNELWPGYKSSQGMDAAVLGQFGFLEEAVAALGVTLWPMTELEADDALASAAAAAAADPAVEQVLILTPDKDLAQCVSGRRVVQFDRRKRLVIDEDGVREKFGVGPESIPDWLALVGDSADGFPGLPGWGAKSAAAALAHYGHLRAIPDDVTMWDPVVVRSVRGAAALASALSNGRHLAALFLELATLRVERSLLARVEDLRWMGPRDELTLVAERLGAPTLATRAFALAEGRAG